MKHQFEGNIYLLGFMGAGKSTIAPILAKKMNLAFIDTDQWIENETGKSIAQIFAEDGEDSFRQYEKKCFEIVSKMSQFVVAAGGGAVMNSTNWLNMKKSGLTVYIKCTPELIMERTAKNKARPLLTGNKNDRFNEIKKLISIRAPYYEYSDIIIDVLNDEPIEKFANRIKKQLEVYI